MNTKGNNAHKQFVDKIIEFNKYLSNKPAMTRRQRAKVVKRWSEGEDKTEQIRKMNEKKRRIKKAKAKRRKVYTSVAAIGLSAVAAITAGKFIYEGAKNFIEQNSPITLEMAFKQGDTPNSLGIDKDTALEIEDIEKILEKGNLTNQEIIALAPRIYSTYFDTVKGKLSNTLKVKQNDIKIYTRKAEEGRTREWIEVKNGPTYVNKDLLRNEYSITIEISDSIKNIAEMQGIMEKIQQGDFNRDAIIEEYKNKVKEISQIAATKFKVDEKQNISVDVTKVKDLNKISNEKTSSKDEGPEL